MDDVLDHLVYLASLVLIKKHGQAGRKWIVEQYDKAELELTAWMANDGPLEHAQNELVAVVVVADVTQADENVQGSLIRIRFIETVETREGIAAHLLFFP